jgi:hypothetical protein
VLEIRKSLPKRLAIINVEHEIQRMEAELSYHEEKMRAFEEALREQQHILSRLQRSEGENYIRGGTQ